MNIAVILAGGIGSRLGANIPKQFVDVLGKPIIAYTIEPFEQLPEIDAVLVVCVKPYMAYIREIKRKYKLDKIKWVTEGGSTFQESVINGVHFLEDKIKADDIVLFHFAASPFITPDIISDAIRVCKEKGTNAISTADYIYLSGKKKNTSSVNASDNYTEEYIDRDTIAVMNTPHAFRYGYVSDMYKEAIESGIINEVEPHTTTLMYAMGRRIYFSKGSTNNIKITTKDDLAMFEGYVLEKERNNRNITESEAVVFLADGFEECEALLTVDILRRANVKVATASIMGRLDVKSSREIMVRADCLAENVDYEKQEMIILPGGRTGTFNLGRNDLVKEKCAEFVHKHKFVAAVCAAPSILASLGLINNKMITIHPDFKDKAFGAKLIDKPVVRDDNIITGKALGATIPFALELAEVLTDKETATRIGKAICYEQQ